MEMEMEQEHYFVCCKSHYSWTNVHLRSREELLLLHLNTYERNSENIYKYFLWLSQ